MGGTCLRMALAQREAGETFSEVKKRPRASEGSIAGQIGALGLGGKSSAPWQFCVGATALIGNPRNLLTRWCGNARSANEKGGRSRPLACQIPVGQSFGQRRFQQHGEP